MGEEADPGAPAGRQCPFCGAVTALRRERCTSCGRNLLATPPSVVRRRLRLAVAMAVLLLAAGVAVAILALRDQEARETRERATSEQRVAALRARLARIQAPHRGSATNLRAPAGAARSQQLAARRALVARVERVITRDARARARAGELDGPIARTACGPLLRSKEAVPDDRDLDKAIGRYDCVAIKRAITDADDATVGQLGHPFVAALDFRKFTYVWCRNTPAQGEAGKALVFVRLERACLAARGKALDTGYVDVPDP